MLAREHVEQDWMQSMLSQSKALQPTLSGTLSLCNLPLSPLGLFGRLAVLGTLDHMKRHCSKAQKPKKIWSTTVGDEVMTSRLGNKPIHGAEAIFMVPFTATFSKRWK